MEETITLNALLPKDQVIIKREYLDELIENSLPAIWDMNDLKRETKLSRHLIFKRILEKPEFASELKGIWFGSIGGSSSHYFDAKEMRKFLKKNKQDIYDL